MYIEKNGTKLDTRFVVPYNMDLLVNNHAHINVDWCKRLRFVKYLFKYINKRPNWATTIMEENLYIDGSIGVQHVTNIKEIKSYLDFRYVSKTEACWRILQFGIHYREPVVKRLGFLLENQQSIVFKDSDYLDNVVNRPDTLLRKITK